MADYQFGLLDRVQQDINFQHGCIKALLDETEITQILEGRGYYESSNKRWWIYPPIVVTAHTQPFQQERQVQPHSRRPAHLWSLPASHQLTLKHDSDQRELGDILIQTLAFLSNTRLQFEDWSHEGRRVVRKERVTSFMGGFCQRHLPETLWQVCERYSSLTPRQRQALRCILHQRNRVHIYHWTWEKFQCLYHAMDACWAFLTPKGRHKKWEGTGQVDAAGGDHCRRMELMQEHLNIDAHQDDTDVFKQWVERRNNLAHEATWASGIPGYTSSPDDHRLIASLNHFLDRLILHCLDVDCSYRTSPGWAGMNSPAFNINYKGGLRPDFNRDVLGMTPSQ